MLHDLRTGWRSLLRSPLFTLTAAGSLALGIGACTVIFSVVYTLLLRPLPYPNSSEMVKVGMSNPLTDEDPMTSGVPVRAFRLMREDARYGFSALGGFTYDYINLTGIPKPTQLLVGQVTADYFRVFGISAQKGRIFQAPDFRSTATPVVLLSNACWRAQFGSSPEIVGQSIILNDQPNLVIGIMPSGFKEASNGCDVWTPLAEDSAEMSPTSPRTFTTVGRLAGGEGTLQTTEAGLATLMSSLTQVDPVRFKNQVLAVRALRSTLVEGGTAHALWLLLGAVACVLLVTCANVANLQLVRAGARRRELGVRLALGATRSRILRLCLAESLLLAFLGGGASLLGAWWGVDTVAALLPPGSSPFQEEVSLNLPVLLFAVFIASLTGVLTGLMPAWMASRQDPADSLSGTSRGASEGPGGSRARAVFVVMEIALALVLLVGAGLMGRSLLATIHTKAGLRTERVLMLNLSVSETRYARGLERGAYLQRLLTSVAASPGVSGIALSTTEPFNWYIPMNFLLPGQTEGAPETIRQSAAYDAVNPEFFSTLDIPILQGRALTAHDRAGAPLAVVVNEVFARRFYPAGNALGSKLTLPGTREPDAPLEIVGVSGSVRRSGLDKEAIPQMYLSYLQRPQSYATLYVRAAGDLSAEGLTKGVQAAIWQVDLNQPIGKISTLAHAVSGSVAPARLYVVLFGTFAALALGLAVLGIYGTVAYSVSQRTREIGIRLALGAQRQDILRLVLGQGARLIVAGLLVGLLVSTGLGHLLTRLLYGVKATDPLTLAGVSILLGVAAFTASYLPARRAMQVDPLQALHEE